MTPQQNEPWDELLAGYILGDLTPEEAVEVKQYLEAHPERLSEVRSLQATLSLLPLALPETSVSPAVATELLQAAEQIILAKAPKREIPSPRKAWKHRLLLMGSILGAVLTIGFAYDSYHLRKELSIAHVKLRQQAPITLPAEELGNRLFTLKATNKTQIASGSLVVAPKGQLVLLTIQNLKPLPRGKVYRLWAFSNGQKMSCGDFNANSEGKVFLQMPLEGLMVYTPTVSITVESSEISTSPKGAMVMVGSQSI
jgi:anti-sigma-K factor RskA